MQIESHTALTDLLYAAIFSFETDIRLAPGVGYTRSQWTKDSFARIKALPKDQCPRWVLLAVYAAEEAYSELDFLHGAVQLLRNVRNTLLRQEV